MPALSLRALFAFKKKKLSERLDITTHFFVRVVYNSKLYSNSNSSNSKLKKWKNLSLRGI